jgi:hypothetical protein
VIRVSILQHPVVVCQRLLIPCKCLMCLLIVEHGRRLLGRRWRRRKVLIEKAIWWPEWPWRPRWCLKRRGRWKLVLEGAEILLATVLAAGAKDHRIRIPGVAHTGACGGSERPLVRVAVSTCLGLGVVGVSGRSCDWSAVGDAVPS